MTKIQWTNETWNPIAGCSKLSAGCKNCYAIKDATRLAGNPNRKIREKYKGTVKDGNWTGRINAAHDDVWTQPIRWTKPRMIFVNSMSDPFHENVNPDWVVRMFAAMALSPHHIFQVLTKRADTMQGFCSAPDVAKAVYKKADEIACDLLLSEWHLADEYLCRGSQDALWPLPNVWLGVSCENQDTADERISHLLETPAAVRWVSAEPLLGPINFTFVENEGYKVNTLTGEQTDMGRPCYDAPSSLDWIIIGGESGPKARSFHMEWLRRIIADCKSANVPVFVKQLGSRILERNDQGFEGDDAEGWPMDTDVSDYPHGYREDYQGADVLVRTVHPKGGDPDEWPETVRVREFPCPSEAAVTT